MNRSSLNARIAEARRSGASIGTCEPVVAELLHGIELSYTRDKNMIRLRRILRLLYC